MRWPEPLLTGFGLLLLMLGGITAFDPSIFTRLYGVSLPTPEASIAIGAIVGGSEIGMAGIILLRQKLGLNSRTLIYVGGAVFIGILAVRSAYIFQYGYRVSTIEVFLETIIAALLLLTAFRLEH